MDIDYIYKQLTNIDIKNTDEEFSEIEHFNKVYSSLNNYFQISNNQFILNESIKYNSWF